MSERQRNEKCINDLYGLDGDIAVDCLWSVLEEMGLDALTDEAVERLAHSQRSAEQLSAAKRIRADRGRED